MVCGRRRDVMNVMAKVKMQDDLSQIRSFLLGVKNREPENVGARQGGTGLITSPRGTGGDAARGLGGGWPGCGPVRDRLSIGLAGTCSSCCRWVGG